MTKLTLGQRRTIVALIGIPGILLMINYEAGFNLLGGYDRLASTIGFVATVLVVVFVAMPAYPEIKEEWKREKKKRSPDERT